MVYFNINEKKYSIFYKDFINYKTKKILKKHKY